MKLVDMTLTQFLNEVDSPSPAPGGGSVGALVGSIGASLGRMVAHLSFGKKKYNTYPEEARAAFEKNFARLVEVKNELSRLVDADTDAYNLVMGAYKLPKDTEEQKAAREAEIQKNLKLAVQTPYETVMYCAEGIDLLGILLQYGNQNAISDIGVGCLMMFAGLEAGIFNVLINLQSITDETYNQDIKEKVMKMKEKSKSQKEEIIKRVEEAML
ncbi:MAG TPA: cyclodeaminase/cyclohydrolase family protein [Fusobacterium sp.]|uniref:cyclodeaminase/cyclohydrolase family protein n=1 Tax=Fusobacterium sp. TaxID=68766 RepID=UPI002F403E49